MKFQIQDKDGIVAGYAAVPLEHAALTMLSPFQALATLQVGETTPARGLPLGGAGKGQERYWVTRVQ
jgi:hypothetical protein